MEAIFNILSTLLLLFATSSASEVHFAITSESTFHQLGEMYCESYASGRQLTDLTCVTLAQQPVYGYIERLDGQDGESSCRICGPTVTGSRVDDTGKGVWAMATSIPDQVLTMETTNGSVITGQGISAEPTPTSLTSGLETDADRGQVLHLYDSCIRVSEPVSSFEGITITFWLKLIRSQYKSMLLHMITTIDGNRVLIQAQHTTLGLEILLNYELEGLVYNFNKVHEAIAMEQWCHVGITFRWDKGVKLFVDGHRKSMQIVPDVVSSLGYAGTKVFLFGCAQEGESVTLEAYVDDLFIWKVYQPNKFMAAYFRQT